ncbi:MAG: chorismate--pyruvate lyase family protein [Pontibacterium sp.]
MPISRTLRQPNFDSHWVSVRRAGLIQAPQAWRSWLTDSGSLTKRLTALSKGQFRVNLVYQGWQQPGRSEARALAMPGRQKALIREVELIGANQTWVYARTVIPSSTLTGRHRTLKQLGNRSLGSLLFSDPGMKRGPLQVSHLRLSDRKTRVWARRSLFYLSDKPLLVCEVFLPALQQVE